MLRAGLRWHAGRASEEPEPGELAVALAQREVVGGSQHTVTRVMDTV